MARKFIPRNMRTCINRVIYMLCPEPQCKLDLAVQQLLAFQQTSNDSHVYECLSSSPECDSNLELRHGSRGGFRTACKRKSDSSAMVGESKVHHQPSFVRSVSLPYCGSETESELYAPYGFYTGDEVRYCIFSSVLCRLNIPC